MKSTFTESPLSKTSEELQGLLEERYESLTGYKLPYCDEFVVRRYVIDGKTAFGCITSELWRDIGIPLVLERYIGYKSGSLISCFLRSRSFRF